jgi:predicted DNA binding CopG/RHH family protein
MSKKKMPKFASEAEEVRFYDEHAEDLEDYFDPIPPEEAARVTGMIAQLAPKEELLRQAREAAEKYGPSKAINLRLLHEDLDRAKALASRKGQGYQTLLKRLIHEGLLREEERLARGEEFTSATDRLSE